LSINCSRLDEQSEDSIVICCIGHDHRFNQPGFSIDDQISLSSDDSLTDRECKHIDVV